MECQQFYFNPNSLFNHSGQTTCSLYVRIPPQICFNQFLPVCGMHGDIFRLKGRSAHMFQWRLAYYLSHHFRKGRGVKRWAQLIPALPRSPKCHRLPPELSRKSAISFPFCDHWGWIIIHEYFLSNTLNFHRIFPFFTHKRFEFRWFYWGLCAVFTLKVASIKDAY